MEIIRCTLVLLTGRTSSNITLTGLLGSGGDASGSGGFRCCCRWQSYCRYRG